MQVFESSAGELNHDDFYEFLFPYLVRIAKEVKAEYKDIPLVIFPRNVPYAHKRIAQETLYDGISIDYCQNIGEAKA